jgi:hypothetical protein
MQLSKGNALGFSIIHKSDAAPPQAALDGIDGTGAEVADPTFEII